MNANTLNASPMSFQTFVSYVFNTEGSVLLNHNGQADLLDELTELYTCSIRDRMPLPCLVSRWFASDQVCINGSIQQTVKEVRALWRRFVVAQGLSLA